MKLKIETIKVLFADSTNCQNRTPRNFLVQQCINIPEKWTRAHFKIFCVDSLTTFTGNTSTLNT